MTQPVKAPFKNRGARRLAWLFSLWAVTALMLSAIWPVRPRLILSNGEGSLIVGITPDNRWLVTLSQRAMAIPREADASADDDQNYESFWSGPIQVWNLHSGEVRHIGLPSQSDDGPIDSTNGFNELGRVDPDAWRVDIPLEPFRDGPFHLVQTNRVGERWSVEIDLNSGSAKRVHAADRLAEFGPLAGGAGVDQVGPMMAK